MHLAFPDTKASTAWYIKYLGATARPDGADGVFFGPIRFNMRKAENLAPSSGSVVDAVGLSFTDLDARLKMLDGSGAKILQTPRNVAGMGRMAVIEDPWGTKLELVEDAKLLGFHHARVLATDPVAMRKWFADALGGENAKLGNADALKFGGIWLIIEKAATPPRPSDGTTIDHLGPNQGHQDGARRSRSKGRESNRRAASGSERAHHLRDLHRGRHRSDRDDAALRRAAV